MGFEIERKFLATADGWQEQATRRVAIRQAYLASGAKASIRVRIKENGAATFTVKSRPHDLRRLEFEYEIPTLEAEALMQLRTGSVIEKVRYEVPWGDLVWEIDVFRGENNGLTIAEIELDREGRQIELPSWIGTEVTGQQRFYNSSLAQNPFCAWPDRDAAAAMEMRAMRA